MDKLSNKILDRIKEQNVHPKARWYFVCMNVFLITAIILSIIIGSIAIAIVIRHFSWTDWELFGHFKDRKIQSFFILLPYLWLIFILFAIFFADQLFRHTKMGYRRKPSLIILVSVLLSVNFGYILYLAKLDRPFENILISNIPFYQTWEKQKDQLFAAPEMGVLAGKIVAINSDKEWLLLDFNNHQWIVYTDQAKLKNNFTPQEGIHIGMIGEPVDETHFQARVITLWKKQIFLPPPPIPPLKISIEKFERNF